MTRGGTIAVVGQPARIGSVPPTRTPHRNERKPKRTRRQAPNYTLAALAVLAVALAVIVALAR